jgi:hypothetical protein
MSKKTAGKPLDPTRAIDLLTSQFIKDYRASLADFPDNKKVELVEHILSCLDCAEIFWKNQTSADWKILADKENAFLKKHGKRLKMYKQKRMYLYYGDRHLLSEKNVYTTDEWNSLSHDKQMFSPSEYDSFFEACRRVLYNERDFLLLEQNPEDEAEERKSKEKELQGTPDKISTKGKQKREAQDNKTYLSQEQTVLLMHYLQQERLFLHDEYLNKTEFGKAIEILTGYSQHTSRQDLGKYQDYQSKENLKKIDGLLTRLKIAIDKDLKQK